MNFRQIAPFECKHFFPNVKAPVLFGFISDDNQHALLAMGPNAWGVVANREFVGQHPTRTLASKALYSAVGGPAALRVGPL